MVGWVCVLVVSDVGGFVLASLGLGIVVFLFWGVFWFVVVLLLVGGLCGFFCLGLRCWMSLVWGRSFVCFFLFDGWFWLGVGLVGFCGGFALVLLAVWVDVFGCVG